MRMSSGPSSRNENPRAASSICIEETPTSRTTPSTAVAPCRAAMASRSENTPSASVRRPWARLERCAGGDSVAIPVDGDHARAGCLQDGARVTAAAESGVEISALATHGEPLDCGGGEYGNVTSQSASDSVAVATHHHSRAPCGGSAAIRVASSALNARTFSVASVSSARKRPGSQNSKFVTEADKRHRAANAGMRFQRVRQYDTPLAVELECLAGAVERERELLALFRVRRKPPDQRFDLRQQTIATRVERMPIQCRVAVQAFETVAHQNGAE